MKLHQEFVVSRPLPEVWTFFHDIPKVASCLPGAEYLGPREDGRHAGKVSTKVGPFQASFEGEANVRYDDSQKAVSLEGKGIDRKGASRGRMTMDCRLEASGEATKVIIDSDVQLSGTIAQFGRTGLITEIANVLIADFVRNAEAGMAAQASQQAEAPASSGNTAAMTPVSRPISAFSLLVISLQAWFSAWFRRIAN